MSRVIRSALVAGMLAIAATGWLIGPVAAQAPVAAGTGGCNQDGGGPGMGGGGATAAAKQGTTMGGCDQDFMRGEDRGAPPATRGPRPGKDRDRPSSEKDAEKDRARDRSR